ncbi:hypothetical protein PV327_005594 [Microctonus hyperodae]|uniref:SEFIR domain-containing protein n=1 Tax=Microctonus hyperodae TaxID=165561 RepID=A0AA39G1Z2_MICHY|nr:hypothetical protein PV327_005594 [Microctonus hyperodae]
MWRINISVIIFIIIALCCFMTNASDSNCYSDFCHKKIIDLPSDGLRCLLTPIERGVECTNLQFHSLGHVPPPGVPLADVKLSAYVAKYPELHTKLTAFNLTVKDATIHRLITRYQDVDPKNSENSHCRHIKLFDFEYSTVTPEIFISCPFSNFSFEGVAYRLEYLIGGKNYEYSRKFIFKVPYHLSIDEDILNIKNYIPFFYIDVSNMNTLSVHIQQLPEKFNVTHYRVWMINNDTDTAKIVELTSTNNKDHLQYNFPVAESIYYFKVTAMHANCGYNGCANSTSPPISTKHPTRRLLIMIISVVWIPPVILYAIYYMYKLYRKQELLKRLNRKPNCLLIYSPTHLAHVNVMSNLAKYLRSCNINAMIDILDIQETDFKDPGLWCNAAFKSADFIVVVTSPVSQIDHETVPVIYRNVDSHAMRLIKENYSQCNKKYVTVEFPYCKSHDVPEEACVFKRLRIPENLDKFVRYIHGIEYLRFLNVSSKELIDSINIASVEIARDRSGSPKNPKETDDLLPSNITPIMIKVADEKHCHTENSLENIPENSKNPRVFTTDIKELNLLGEDLVIDQEGIKYISSVPDGEFRIDQLKL